MPKKHKRPSGLLTKEGSWLVLTESKGDTKKSWVHKCGHDIMGKEIILSNRDGIFPLSGDGSTKREAIPFCPNCEREPLQGTYGLKGVQISS